MRGISLTHVHKSTNWWRIYIFFPPVLSHICYSLNIIQVCTRTCSHKDDCGVQRRRSEGQTCMGSRGTCTLRGHLLSPPRPWTDVAGCHIGDASLLCLRGNRAARRKHCLLHIQRQTTLNVIVFASAVAGGSVFSSRTSSDHFWYFCLSITMPYFSLSL